MCTKQIDCWILKIKLGLDFFILASILKLIQRLVFSIYVKLYADIAYLKGHPYLS